ncbi:MauE/DoxX family redox-associated membrane protein [Mucilaginibacter antarcticus]
MYHVIARNFKAWGYIYAGIELLLGLAFAIDFLPLLTNIVTVIVMAVSIIGVLQSVLNKRAIRCACLGAVFNLPMSTVTIIEDGLMIAMSAVSIFMLT